MVSEQRSLHHLLHLLAPPPPRIQYLVMVSCVGSPGQNPPHRHTFLVACVHCVSAISCPRGQAEGSGCALQGSAPHRSRGASVCHDRCGAGVARSDRDCNVCRYTPPSRPLGSLTPTQPGRVTSNPTQEAQGPPCAAWVALVSRWGGVLRSAFRSARREPQPPAQHGSYAHALPSAAAQEHVPAKGCHLACIQAVPRDISW